MAGLTLNPGETMLSRIVQVVRQLIEGKSNATGTFTLTANAGSTQVTAPTCGLSSVILYSPLTAHASAEIGNGTIYISGVALGSFTLTHANNAQVDRTFGYEVRG